MKTTAFRVLAVLIILAMALPGQGLAQAPKLSTFQVAPEGITSVEQIDLGNAVKTTDGRVRVIVELQEPPLALYTGGTLQFAPTRPEPGNKLDVNSPASQAYIQHLVSVQDEFITSLATSIQGVEVGYRYQAAFNGMALTLTADQVKAVAQMPEVKQVYPVQVREAEMDASLPIIQAQALWDQLGGRANAGQGIKIADVDTGVRPENPMFSGEGFSMPPGYPRGYCVTNPADPDFQCNDKLIAARIYSAPSGTDPAEFPSPLDMAGHGTHTAGTAAGNVTTVQAGNLVPTDTVISGVAPGAYLMVYKALWEKADHSNASGTDDALMAALNDSLLDGADVVNNSWGGGAGDPNASPYKTLLAALTAAGEVVVFSAGNSGPSNGTIGCPGCVEDAITVAASNNTRVIANAIDVTAPAPVPSGLVGMAGQQGDGPAISADISGEVVFAGDLDGNTLGCSAFPAGSMTGKIALISRGTCNFSVKIGNAQTAGAIFAIIYNNAGGPPSSMTVPGPTIPSVMISMDDGLALVDYIHAHPEEVQILAHKEISRTFNPAWADVMAGFSSVGPNGDLNVLKPDITAPGVNILSAFSPALGGQDFAFLQGTSMAAPHITGSAALLVAQHPDWTPAQIKTALTSTSVQGLVKSDGVTPADPFNMGAGRVDLSRAGDAGLTFDKPSFASGACVVNCSWSRTIKNVGSEAATWTAEVQADPGLSITVEPSTFTAGPGLQGDFQVTADVTGLAPGEWYFGAVIWKDSSGTHPDAYLPLAVQPVETSSPAALIKTVSSPEVESGSVVTYTIELANTTPVTTTYDLVDPVPTGATYVDGSAQGLTFDPATKTLSAKVELSPASLDVVPSTDSPAGFLPLSSFFDPLTCTGTGCDEGLFNFTLPMSFVYNGTTYSRIGMTTNGYAVVGGGTAADIVATPQSLPNPAVPNNVLAPFWADLDFTSAGDMYAGILTDGVTNWMILEWNGVPAYGTDTPLYSFQIWIQLDNSGQIWYTYGTMGDTASLPLSVGAEDAYGSLGKSYYYNGTGTAPVTGDELKVTSVIGGAATFKYAATLEGNQDQWVTNVVHVYNNQDSKVLNAVAMTQIVLPSLELTKTVGLDPHACAGTDSLTVVKGTTVTYCFKATNNGSIPLVTHTLVDDDLGKLLDNTSYTLDPGASYFITATQVITASTVSTATWTALTALPSTVSAADSTTVDLKIFQIMLPIVASQP